jgi:hypothetical protein
VRRARRPRRAVALDPALQAASDARQEAVALVRHEMTEALDRARTVMNQAVARAGLAVRGSAQPMKEAVSRSQRAVQEALGRLPESAGAEETARAVAEAGRLTGEAVSAGLAAEQSSLKVAQDGVAAALQATAEAVAQAGRLIGAKSTNGG